MKDENMFGLDKTKVNERDMVLFGEPYIKEHYGGRIRRFEDMNLEKLEKLVALNVVHMEDRQGSSSPSIMETMAFMRTHPKKFLCSGYAVSPDRSDYRISIESVYASPEKGAKITEQDRIDFTEMYSHADDFNDDTLYAYYD